MKNSLILFKISFVISYVVGEDKFQKILQVLEIVPEPVKQPTIGEMFDFVEKNWRNYILPDSKPNWVHILKLLREKFDLGLKDAKDIVFSNKELRETVQKWNRDNGITYPL
jgi:ribosomal protein L7/L12